MKKIVASTGILLFAVALLLPAAPVKAADVAWELDAGHSSVGFVVRHLGISKVRGKFATFNATIKASEKDGKIVSVQAEADVNSVDTGIKKRDDHLRAPDFFDAKKFPKMMLKTKRITWKGDDVIIVADLTIKGVTKTVEFKGEYLGSQKANFGTPQLRAGYSLKGVINRQDFGLSFNAIAEGVSIVADKVIIELEIEMVLPLKK